MRRIDEIYEVLLGIKSDCECGADTKLFSSGEWDSFDMIQLINSLMERYDVDINPGDIGVENFDTPADIASYMDMVLGEYINPVVYADYSDPDVVRVGEDYYMVASSFSNAPALPILHSTDLVHWRLLGYCLDEIPDGYDKPRHGCGVWAPAIRYHEGTFYVYFPMPDEGIYVTTSKDPKDTWTKPVNIRPGAGHIDPCPFWDEDGKAYLVSGVAKSRIGYKSVLYMQEMTPDGLSLVGEMVKVFDGNDNGQTTIEGPKLYKRGEYYYILAPAGGVKPGWQLALRSKSIWGPYEYRTVLESGDSGINGPHQGAWVDTVCGEDYFLHFRDVYSAGRIVYLEPVRWENDWPVMGDKGVAVLKGVIPKGLKSMHEYLPVSDDFKKGIGVQWQWNANFKDTFFEIVDGGLKLNCLKRSSEYMYDEPNILLQKWVGNAFETEFLMDASGLLEGDILGVCHGSVEYMMALVKREDDKLNLYSVTGEQKFNGPAHETFEERKKVLEISGDSVRFKYRVSPCDEKVTVVEGVSYPLERVEIFLWNGRWESIVSCYAVPGRWVGVKYGVFAMAEAGGGGYAIVKNVVAKHL